MPRLAVLGQPVVHSRSPAMQNAALDELGLAPEWSYEAIEVAPDRFEELVRSMGDTGFAGANVTVPHKLAALAVADRASAAARAIGAANTLSFAEGSIEAENTDATGITAGRFARPGPRSRSGTAPPSAPGRSPRSSASRSRSPTRPSRSRPRISTCW
jgi:shikimate 5-dehydrogenase